MNLRITQLVSSGSGSPMCLQWGYWQKMRFGMKRSVLTSARYHKGIIDPRQWIKFMALVILTIQVTQTWATSLLFKNGSLPSCPAGGNFSYCPWVCKGWSSLPLVHTHPEGFLWSPTFMRKDILLDSPPLLALGFIFSPQIPSVMSRLKLRFACWANTHRLQGASVLSEFPLSHRFWPCSFLPSCQSLMLLGKYFSFYSAFLVFSTMNIGLNNSTCHITSNRSLLCAFSTPLD